MDLCQADELIDSIAKKANEEYDCRGMTWGMHFLVHGISLDPGEVGIVGHRPKVKQCLTEMISF